MLDGKDANDLLAELRELQRKQVHPREADTILSTVHKAKVKRVCHMIHSLCKKQKMYEMFLDRMLCFVRAGTALSEDENVPETELSKRFRPNH